MNPEDKFTSEGKDLRPPVLFVPKEVMRMSFVGCPWCGEAIPVDQDRYIEHVRDCRKERANAD